MMGRKLSPENDEVDPALLREWLSRGDERLLSEAEVAKVRAATVEAMRAAGIRPALVYAYERTGLIVTRENRHLISAADLDEWEDAVTEYEVLTSRALHHRCLRARSETTRCRRPVDSP